MSIYKACDIRGKYGLELTEEHAARLGGAIYALKGQAQVLVAGDGRLSTPALKSALIHSLVRLGCRVTDLGMAPTPLFYFARQRLGIETGVMVTASHNPAPDNGFKVTLGPLPITEEEMADLAQRMEEQPQPAPENPTCQVNLNNLLPAYLDWLAGLTPDLSGLKVVVDCANGMAGLIARRIWQNSGAQGVYLLEDVDGSFPAHAPNPAESKNLALLQSTVLKEKADLGVAYDGDGDRVTFVDETGRPLSSDKTIVLFAQAALHSPGGTVIYDQKCSRIVPDSIRKLGGAPVMELSGHTYIKRAFLTRQAAYAGELSGHHFLRAAGGDDGFAASLFFAGLLKGNDLPLSKLADAIPAYPITPDIRIPMPGAQIQELLARLQDQLGAEATLLRTDGLRIEYSDGWALIRPSVTEPVLTLRFEGVNSTALQRIIQRVESAAPELSGKLHY